MVVSIDSHSENPCFPVQLVDTYHVKLGVEELGVEELAEAGAFQDALQQIPQFTGLFCQRRYPSPPHIAPFFPPAPL